MPHLASANVHTLKSQNIVDQLYTNGFEEVSSYQTQGSSESKAFLKNPSISHSNPGASFNSERPIQINVYIEGDGASWKGRQIPPKDPTPETAMGAKLASADNYELVGYLGRPCMYLTPLELQSCPQTLWTSGRFGEKALDIVNQALDDLLEFTKKSAGLKPTSRIQINLIGYSGGGVLATLLAARRSDISCFVTIASPLDIEVWTGYQHIAPLSDSFNPAYPDAHLSTIPQTHFFGANDKIVPAESLGRYQNWSQNYSQSSVIQILPNFNHHQFWVEKWNLLKSRSCLNAKN